MSLDRVTVAPAGQIEGQIVRGNSTPPAAARILFVCADRREPRQTVSTDAAGRFRVSLSSGGWLLYVQGDDGKPVFHRKIEVRQNETRQVYLVSRAY